MAEENNYPPLSVSNNSNVHAVRTLQTLLNNHGANLYVDGRYAIGTDRAVAAFQQSKKIDVVGYVDEKTWKALSKAKASTKKASTSKASTSTKKAPAKKTPAKKTAGKAKAKK